VLTTGRRPGRHPLRLTASVAVATWRTVFVANAVRQVDEQGSRQIPFARCPSVTDPFGTSEGRSRRARPAKPLLSRDVIVEEALRQITSENDGAMSLRKIAKALDTGPVSLYAYVNDMSEPRALVLDRAGSRQG